MGNIFGNVDLKAYVVRYDGTYSKGITARSEILKEISALEVGYIKKSEIN